MAFVTPLYAKRSSNLCSHFGSSRKGEQYIFKTTEVNVVKLVASRLRKTNVKYRISQGFVPQVYGLMTKAAVFHPLKIPKRKLVSLVYASSTLHPSISS